MCQWHPHPFPIPPPDPGTMVPSQDPCDGFLTGPPLALTPPQSVLHPAAGVSSKVSETLLLFSSKPTPLTQTGSWSPFHVPRTPPDLTLASPCDLIADQPPPRYRLRWLHPLLSLEQPCIRPPQGLCTCCSPYNQECPLSAYQHCLLPHSIHVSAKFSFS